MTYGYGGDGLRRWREVSGGDYTWYNWAMGYSVINEEAEGLGVGNGTLERTYIPGLAEVAGSNPATGDYVYYFKDHLGSTRRLLDEDKNTDATYEFTPYGEVYAHTGDDTSTHLFTGHDWDSTAALYFAPYRYYSPAAARWLTRDPLGMADGPNVYAYVRGNPIAYSDETGLITAWVLIRIAWLTYGVVVGFLCAKCMADAINTIEFAARNLPIDQFCDWFFTAKPGKECGGLCLQAAFVAIAEIIRFAARSGAESDIGKRCCPKK